MPIDVLLPALSPTMTEGIVSRWLVQEGDSVSAGQPIVEIETDKAAMEVEAADEGTVGKILIAAGTENVAVNTPIAVLLEPGESVDVLTSRQPSADTGKPAPTTTAPTPTEPTPTAPIPTAPTTTAPTQAPSPEPASGNPVAATQPGAQSSGRIFASPLARRLAAERQLDLALIVGSGPHGRIIKADVDNAPSPAAIAATLTTGATGTAKAEAPAQAETTALEPPFTLEPASRVRSIIAQRLTEAKQAIPHFYLEVTCVVDALLQIRQKINALTDDGSADAVKVSVNDMIIKLAASALQAVPQANVQWTDAGIKQFHRADISVAVATDNGLITPIIRDVASKSLRTIAIEMKDLAQRARAGKLAPHEFQGGTFSISNLGMFGIEAFSAIINPPQASILAVGASVARPVVLDGSVAIAHQLTLTLSVDHRVIDGAVGAAFLKALKTRVENPLLLLV